jgi:hypothetical protein
MYLGGSAYHQFRTTSLLVLGTGNCVPQRVAHRIDLRPAFGVLLFPTVVPKVFSGKQIVQDVFWHTLPEIVKGMFM